MKFTHFVFSFIFLIFSLTISSQVTTANIYPNNLIGSKCDDNNNCTSNDIYNSSCDCAGTPVIGCIECLENSPCDDGFPCSYQDMFDDKCDCKGSFVNDCDLCVEGSPCDDSNDCTFNDVFDADCNCKGTNVTGCVMCEIDLPCDDRNPCTTNDKFLTGCNCEGESIIPSDIAISHSAYNNCSIEGVTLSINYVFDTYAWILNGEEIDNIAIIEIKEHGNYTLYASSNDCFFEYSINVPDFTGDDNEIIQANTIEICKNESILLSIPQEYSSQKWYDEDMNLVSSDLIYDAINPGNYFVEAKLDGCLVKDRIIISRNIPHFSTVPDFPLICQNNAINMSLNETFEQVKWYDENGVLVNTGQEFNTSSAGNYSVEVTVNSGCTRSQTVIVHSENNTDLEQILLEKGFVIANITIGQGLKGKNDDNKSPPTEMMLLGGDYHINEGTSTLYNYLNNIYVEISCKESAGGIYIEEMCGGVNLEEFFGYIETYNHSILAYVLNVGGEKKLFIR